MKMIWAMICCIHVVPDLYAVAITMSSSRGLTTSQAPLSKWCDSYVLVLVQPRFAASEEGADIVVACV